MPQLARLYQYRFREADVAEKRRIWRVLCRYYFQRLVGENRVVVDLACGYGEFINAIAARVKYGIDLNPDSRGHLAPEVAFINAPAHDTGLEAGCADVVFTSNFLEHLRSKEECDLVFAEILRILRPQGRFIVMGPNIRYLADKYWDFYDHTLPFSHLSMKEGLAQAGFEPELVIDKFLPYTTRSVLPQGSRLIAFYLHMPWAWRLLGKQFLVTGRKP
jgi:SAM-dependent methyltransferase